ncbi:MAG TPA: lipoprotein signal peptidase, partial [Acidimicrobiaceae bacterium]|nr:lipoprotein signal peptidase [Acidimicrobiaceae bacterium]
AGLLLGGAVANLVDRLIGGTVVDFLDLGWWPSFNLADVALVVGCGLLVVDSLREPATGPD